MKPKEAFATVIGTVQATIGVLSIVISFSVYYDPSFLPVRTILALPSEYATFYVMMFFTVGVFAMLSGFLILHQWLSGS